MTATVEAVLGEDWAAVAEAIRTRMAELQLTQKKLAEQSGVSESTIRQLIKNYGPRRRNRHTLQDLSVGLGWPAGHLSHILGEVVDDADRVHSLRAEVADLRSRLADLAGRVEALEHGRRSG